jgi:hypothetical protein
MKTRSALKMDSYRRRHSRRAVAAQSIKVAINGTDYDCLNCSPGGLLLSGAMAPAGSGDPVVGVASFAGCDGIEFAATVIHIGKDQREFGLRHTDLALDEALQAFLER